MEKFVYDGIEVTKTGRRAVKIIERPRGDPMKFYLYEITPAEDQSWKKWVDDKELYKIED